MNRRPNTLPKSERGSTLLVTLCFATVLAISVASYQTLAYYTLKTGTAGVQNSRSMQMAEAGMEEAIYALNNSTWTGWSLVSGNATKTISGFTLDTGITGSATITITNYAGVGSNPRLTVDGSVTDAAGNTTTRTFTANTGVSSTATSGHATLFNNALAAVGIATNGLATATYGNVNFTYNGITVDSYNASTGSYAAGSATYSATVAAIAVGTDSTAVSFVNAGTPTNGAGAVNIGTATIKGYVSTTPTSGGSAAYTNTSGKLIGTAAGTGIDTSRLSTGPYQLLQTIANPTSTSVPGLVDGGSVTAPTSSTIHLGTAGATSPTKYTANIDSNGAFDVESSGVIEIDGPVILIVPGNFYIGATASGGKVKINNVASSNASLQVFVAGYTYIAGNGIDNTTLLAKNLAILNTSSYSGYYTLFYTDTPFYGAVYAPNTDVYLYGKSTTSHFYGSYVGRNAYAYNFTSTMGIHYDVSLRDATFTGVPATPFAISSVTEQ